MVSGGLDEGSSLSGRGGLGLGNLGDGDAAGVSETLRYSMNQLTEQLRGLVKSLGHEGISPEPEEAMRSRIQPRQPAQPRLGAGMSKLQVDRRPSRRIGPPEESGARRKDAAPRRRPAPTAGPIAGPAPAAPTSGPALGSSGAVLMEMEKERVKQEQLQRLEAAFQRSAASSKPARPLTSTSPKSPSSGGEASKKPAPRVPIRGGTRSTGVPSHVACRRRPQSASVSRQRPANPGTGRGAKVRDSVERQPMQRMQSAGALTDGETLRPRPPAVSSLSRSLEDFPTHDNVGPGRQKLQSRIRAATLQRARQAQYRQEAEQEKPAAQLSVDTQQAASTAMRPEGLFAPPARSAEGAAEPQQGPSLAWADMPERRSPPPYWQGARSAGEEEASSGWLLERRSPPPPFWHGARSAGEEEVASGRHPVARPKLTVARPGTVDSSVRRDPPPVRRQEPDLAWVESQPLSARQLRPAGKSPPPAPAPTAPSRPELPAVEPPVEDPPINVAPPVPSSRLAAPRPSRQSEAEVDASPSAGASAPIDNALVESPAVSEGADLKTMMDHSKHKHMIRKLLPSLPSPVAHWGGGQSAVSSARSLQSNSSCSSTATCNERIPERESAVFSQFTCNMAWDLEKRLDKGEDLARMVDELYRLQQIALKKKVKERLRYLNAMSAEKSPRWVERRVKKVCMRAEADQAEIERQMAESKAQHAKRKLYLSRLSERTVWSMRSSLSRDKKTLSSEDESLPATPTADKAPQGEKDEVFCKAPEANEGPTLLTETEASDADAAISSTTEEAVAVKAEADAPEDEQALNQRLQVLRGDMEATLQEIRSANNLKEKESKLRLYQKQKEAAKRLYEKKQELINERVRLIQLEQEEREVDDLLDKALKLNVDEEVQRQITSDVWPFAKPLSTRQEQLHEEAQKENVMPDEEAQAREQHLERLREELAEKRRAVERLHAERQKERQAREERQLLQELHRWEEEAQKLCKPSSESEEEESARCQTSEGDVAPGADEARDAALDVEPPAVQESFLGVLEEDAPELASSVAFLSADDETCPPVLDAPPRPPSPPPQVISGRSASAPSRSPSSRKKKEVKSAAEKTAVADVLLEQLMTELWSELDTKPKGGSQSASRATTRSSSRGRQDPADSAADKLSDHPDATAPRSEVKDIVPDQVSVHAFLQEVMQALGVADADAYVDAAELQRVESWRSRVVEALRAAAAEEEKQEVVRWTFDEAWIRLLVETTVEVAGQSATSEPQVFGWRRAGLGERPTARFEQAARRSGNSTSWWTWVSLRQRVEDLLVQEAGCCRGHAASNSSAAGGGEAKRGDTSAQVAESAADAVLNLDKIDENLDALLEDEIYKDEAAWLDLDSDVVAIKKQVSQLLFADLVHDVAVDIMALWSA
eukprot:TRINITY_DN22199_c0_g1_i1.p1 TRINITY_DN22199_c0_g1~~TRINITY_DN22199_c0_g1_i1.p1  ORF type:complete len:1397 (-),score=328.74 TRINITY_DN22199_c0_g1_i1:183-4373(-)